MKQLIITLEFTFEKGARRQKKGKLSGNGKKLAGFVNSRFEGYCKAELDSLPRRLRSLISS
jgi:hypothetical protein